MFVAWVRPCAPWSTLPLSSRTAKEKMRAFRPAKLVQIAQTASTSIPVPAYAKSAHSPLTVDSLSAMAEAVWNGVTIASTPKFETVEGNVYFPPSAIKMEYVKPSSTKTTCGWKGEASYYSVVVDGQENKDAAWYYPTPKAAAANIKDHVAFWKGVKVTKK